MLSLTSSLKDMSSQMSRFFAIVASISISVTVNYEGMICYSAGSLPSLPRPSHPPPWASDGEEPSPHFPIRSDLSLTPEIEILSLL